MPPAKKSNRKHFLADVKNAGHVAPSVFHRPTLTYGSHKNPTDFSSSPSSSLTKFLVMVVRELFIAEISRLHHFLALIHAQISFFQMLQNACVGGPKNKKCIFYSL